MPKLDYPKSLSIISRYLRLGIARIEASCLGFQSGLGFLRPVCIMNFLSTYVSIGDHAQFLLLPVGGLLVLTEWVIRLEV